MAILALALTGMLAGCAAYPWEDREATGTLHPPPPVEAEVGITSDPYADLATQERKPGEWR